MEGKKASFSRVEMAQLMMPQDANPAGNVFGGVIMKLIDMAAGVVSSRHVSGNTVTACMERMDFHAPVYVGNLVIVKASLNYVGRTSMEVGARVEAEDLFSGKRTHTGSCYLTVVTLDENHRPRLAPPLILETEEDRRRFNQGKERQEWRQKTRKRK